MQHAPVGLDVRHSAWHIDGVVVHVHSRHLGLLFCMANMTKKHTSTRYAQVNNTVFRESLVNLAWVSDEASQTAGELRACAATLCAELAMPSMPLDAARYADMATGCTRLVALLGVLPS